MCVLNYSVFLSGYYSVFLSGYFIATDPAKIKVSKNPSKSREVFKTDSHGRMIIEEESDAMAGGLSEQLKVRARTSVF